MAEEILNPEEMDDVLILVDEEDNEHPFRMIDMVELDGNKYAVLVPEEDNEDDEAVILRIEEDENGDELLVDIEDDEEWEKVVDTWNDSFEE